VPRRRRRRTRRLKGTLRSYDLLATTWKGVTSGTIEAVEALQAFANLSLIRIVSTRSQPRRPLGRIVDSDVGHVDPTIYRTLRIGCIERPREPETSRLQPIPVDSRVPGASACRSTRSQDAIDLSQSTADQVDHTGVVGESREGGAHPAPSPGRPSTERRLLGTPASAVLREREALKTGAQYASELRTGRFLLSCDPSSACPTSPRNDANHQPLAMQESPRARASGCGNCPLRPPGKVVEHILRR